MTDVFLTIDTEISPVRTPDWRANSLFAEIARDISGHTTAGSVGIQYQADLLNQYGLKATFFVEALFACVVGLDPLRGIVDSIASRRQDVQLHLHPDWLHYVPDACVQATTESTMRSFTLAEQKAVIEQGLENFRRCGISRVSCFRAGDFDANLDSLRALRSYGIGIDSSINLNWGHAWKDIAGRPLLEPCRIEGVLEIPVTTFSTFLGTRPFQISACSTGEMESALMAAWKRNAGSVVVLSHCFELLRRTKIPGRFGSPSALRRGRFQWLCEFLHRHRDKFRTRFFREMEDEPPVLAHAGEAAAPLRVPVRHTVRRCAEQALDHFLMKQGGRRAAGNQRTN